MTDTFKVEVKGIKELQNTFKIIEKDLQDILSKAVSQGAAVVEKDAKMRVVVKTGTLRRSIREIKKVRSPTRAESQVGTDIKYAARVEFGYTGPDKRGRKFHQVAQPYLRPALDNNKDKINSTVEAYIANALARYR